MLLQPRNFNSKKKQKDRRFRHFNNTFNLNFGTIGLLTLKPFQLTAGQVFRLKLLLKRSIKKSDKTRRSIWFYSFPHLPLSKKPVGLRMGKGKGKLECWFTNIRGGTILFEFKNLRFGRAVFFIKQIQHKLGSKMVLHSKSSKYYTLPINQSQTFKIKSF